MLKTAVLVSGGGTNLQAILDAIRNQSPEEAMTNMLNHIAGVSN